MIRNTTALKYDWKFTREITDAGMAMQCDDSSWETVRVPHDWAIAGPFDRENDIQRIVEKQADVEVGVREITGRTGGLPFVGQAWYRKELDIPVSAEGSRFRIEFDGVMSRSYVYCNGKLAGYWPYGYSSFAFDITDLVTPGEKNILAIHVDNPEDSSRWYLS